MSSYEETKLTHIKKIPQQDGMLKWPMNDTISTIVSHFQNVEKNLEREGNFLPKEAGMTKPRGQHDTYLGKRWSQIKTISLTKGKKKRRQGDHNFLESKNNAERTLQAKAIIIP